MQLVVVTKMRLKEMKSLTHELKEFMAVRATK